MGLFKRRRESGEQRTLAAGNVPPVMLSSTPGGSVSPTGSLAIAPVYAAVRVLVDAAASTPLVPYRRTSGGRERLEQGLLPELLKRPAPATTQAGLIGQLVAHLNLYGNCYLAKYRDGGGEVVQLGLLHPERVSPEIKAGRPRYKVRDERGRETEHGIEDVLHIRAPLSVDGLTGLSPIGQCKVAAGLASNLAAHAAVFFENGGLPAGVLKAPAGNSEALDRVRAAWEQKHTGVRNAHRIAVVSGDVEFMQITGPLDELQFVEQRQLSTAEIARIFRVPPWMIGASDDSSMTYSNTEQQQLAFVMHSLRPWLVCIEQAVTADADLCRDREFVEFLLDSQLRADHKTRAEVYALALDPERGWMSRAEVRRLENLDPEEQS